MTLNVELIESALVGRHVIANCIVTAGETQPVFYSYCARVIGSDAVADITRVSPDDCPDCQYLYRKHMGRET